MTDSKTELSSPKVALVTGASRGIGKAIAHHLAKQGATLVCVSHSETSCGAAVAALRDQGYSAHALAVDVADSAAVKKACAQLIEQFSCIDILVNNAGITRDNLVFRMTEDDWNVVIQTNLSSCFYWIKGLLRPMTQKRWGRIVNIASVVGLIGNAGQVNYAAAKAGMIGLTKSLAREVASRNITVNAVAPGFTETDMTAALSDSTRQMAVQAIPLKRFGSVDDIAAAVAFLCSDSASYITGQVLPVDGGMAMG